MKAERGQAVRSPVGGRIAAQQGAKAATTDACTHTKSAPQPITIV